VLSLDLRVDERDVAALGRAVGAGVRVVACTGRPFPGALPWVHRLGLRDPFVCYQGAQVRGLDGSMLLDHGVAHELAMEVVRWCRERHVHVQAYRDDELFVEHDTPYGRAYSEHAGMEMHVVPDLDAAMGPTTPKVVMVADEADVERMLPEVRRQWAGRLYAATSMPTYIEFTNVDADKRRALEFLCRELDVSEADTVAVGDGRNDLPMLEWAALGVAVSTAAPEVLAAAGRVIGPPGSGGIAELIDGLLSS